MMSCRLKMDASHVVVTGSSHVQPPPPSATPQKLNTSATVHKLLHVLTYAYAEYGLTKYRPPDLF